MSRRTPPLRRAYTLIELLVVVTVLGIAATMVVPAFSQGNSLRLQAAVRMIVSDLTQAQSDAVALQAPQGLLFNADDEVSGYVVGPVSNGTIDTAAGIGVRRIIGGEEFGQAATRSLLLSNRAVYFDELGGPVTTAGGHTPAGTQSLDISSPHQAGYRLLIEAYTGRITVQSLETEDVPLDH